MHRLATVHARDNQPTNDVTTQPISISEALNKISCSLNQHWQLCCPGDRGRDYGQSSYGSGGYDSRRGGGSGGYQRDRDNRGAEHSHY